MSKNQLAVNSVQVDLEWPDDQKAEPAVMKTCTDKPGQVCVIINQPVSHKTTIKILLSLLDDSEERLASVISEAPTLLDGERYLTPSQVAAALHCSETTVKRLRLSGALAYRPGKPMLIPESALKAHLSRTTGRFVSFEESEPDLASPTRAPYQRGIIQAPTSHQSSEEAASARAREMIVLRRLTGPIKRERLTFEEKERRAAFERRKQLAKERQAKAKKLTQPKTL